MTKPAPASQVSRSSIRPVYAALLILAAVLLAWSNSFSAPFEFDDHGSIIDNASIRRLAPPTWLRPPATGETVSGRPVLNFTFAVNYAAGGLDVRGYHAVNLLIHGLAALTLFGIVRRTLLLPYFSGSRLLAPGPGGRAGERLPTELVFATVAALLWAVHPLQTESVTYIVQRAESLAGLFSLLTLYGFIRGAQAVKGRSWYVLSFVSCLLGLGTKETVAVMPLIVLLYDRAFLSASLREAWRQRGGAHGVLWALWLPLVFLVLGSGGNRGGTFAFTPEGLWLYWVAQLKAVTHYLRLTLWPHPLSFDYPFFRLSLAEALPYAVVILPLAAAAVWGFWKRTVWGFLGACFFILLAPTSLMPGLIQVIVEHRMYLALAAPVILLLAALRIYLPRAWLVLGALAVVALGATTFARNQVYRSELSLWQDTVAKSPGNSRAYYNLGMALLQTGRVDEAAVEFGRAVALRPEHAFAHFQLGVIAMNRQQWPEAAGRFEAAVASDGHYVAARVNLGRVLTELGRPAEAIAQYQAALADEPTAVDARTNLAGLLIGQGRVAEAEAILRDVLAAEPGLAEAHYHYGMGRTRSGAPREAEQEFLTAVQLKPGFAAAHVALGNARAARGDAAGAEAAYREALRLDPGLAEGWYGLGNLFAQAERFAEAMTAYQAALERDPRHVQARGNLANCQLVTGRFDEAIANYEAVLRARPNDNAVRRNLELAREMKREGGR